MFSSGSSTSDAESVAAGLQTAVEVGEHEVTAASSVASGVLQADAAAKQKPAPECLLNSTEAISSPRLYSNRQTHRGDREKKSLKAQKNKPKYRGSVSTSCNDHINQSRVKLVCLGDQKTAS